MNEADLLTDYPTLTTDDLANAWAYVQAHPGEFERQIEEQESA